MTEPENTATLVPSVLNHKYVLLKLSRIHLFLVGCIQREGAPHMWLLLPESIPP